MEFTVIQGDIAAQRADTLVNAAGTSLQMGSGVAGALRRGANGPINEDAVSKGPIELGSVAVTDAYELDAEYVIHAAAMPHYSDRTEQSSASSETQSVSGSRARPDDNRAQLGDGRASAESIREATHSSLEQAEELGCESIVIPVLGTGAADFSFEEGATCVCDEIWNYESATLADVRVIAYSQREYETLERIAADIRET